MSLGSLLNLQYVIPKVDFDSQASKIETVEFKVIFIAIAILDFSLLLPIKLSLLLALKSDSEE